MAIYHLSAGAVCRSQGQSAVAAAAYRSRSELEDKRTGETHDYSKAAGLEFSGIYAPANAPAWAKDRAELWNRAEAADSRKNSRPARDLVLALPHELTAEENRRLVQDFVREQFVRKGLVADVAIHAPHRHGDDRNTHAHVLLTTRTIDAAGFSRNKPRDLYDKAELQGWREAWGRLTNRHLERAGHDARIDHRSLAEQGVDRAATVHLGKHAAALERDGIPTELGDHNRAAARLINELDRPAAERAFRADSQAAERERDHAARVRIREDLDRLRQTQQAKGRPAPETGLGGRKADLTAEPTPKRDYRPHAPRKRDMGADLRRASRAVGNKARDIGGGAGRFAGVGRKGANTVLGVLAVLLGGFIRDPRPPPGMKKKEDRPRSKMGEAIRAAQEKEARQPKPAPEPSPEKEREQDRGRSRFDASPALRLLQHGTAGPTPALIAWILKARERLIAHSNATGDNVLAELEGLAAILASAITGRPRRAPA